MEKVVIDTSVIVDFIRAKKGVLPVLLQKKNRLYIPTIVIAELWAGESVNDLDEQKLTERLLTGFKTVGLTKQIAKHTGELIRNSRVEEPADAIVAASALYLDARLATSNIKHFKKVKGLRLFGQ